MTPEIFRDLSFDNSFLRAMPADPRSDTASRRLTNVSYSLTAPTPVREPKLLSWSNALAAELGLPACAEGHESLLASLFSGNALLDGSVTYATRYGGHQFGNWAGQLGDGRAISLGELVTKNGERQELQLKGAGPTAYSRRADGRAVLRSSLREYLCSEAMFALGVPTTRALSLVTTGEEVLRDMFYNGRPKLEAGAVVCRVSPSFLRFGHFELHAAEGERELLERLFDYLIEKHYPHLAARSSSTGRDDVLVGFFEEITQRTIDLVVHWQRVGFVHGVMNTDNLSLIGVTIDYGPYGFLEPYEPHWTPNTTDAQGRRYCYRNQPKIALWNLARLGEALLALFSDEKQGIVVLTAALEQAQKSLAQKLSHMMARKLGLANEQEGFVQETQRVLEVCRVDYTLFFRTLAELAETEPSTESTDRLPALSALIATCYEPKTLVEPELARWFQALAACWAARPADQKSRGLAMKAVNPRVVPRNWLAQEAIDAACEGDVQPLHRLMAVLSYPYRDSADSDRYAALRPLWAENKAGCAMLSCSS